MEFQSFSKIPRLSRDIIITEKIDGTNAQIFVIRYEYYWNREGIALDSAEAFLNEYCLYKTLAMQDENDILYLFAGSRNRWLNIHNDNYGFANWVKENAEELIKLGEGRHYGEWYGKGIQRGYELDEKRFALFNVRKWASYNEIIELKDKKNYPPDCCEVVPILYEGKFDTNEIEYQLNNLKEKGSFIVPNFMNPEGIIIYHKASGQLFKKTIENDEKPKRKL